MPKLPKYNSSKLFHKLAHEVKVEFEKQGRTEKWNDIQKWTSANLYYQYKGRSYKQVAPEEILKDILFIITPKEKRKCGNVFTVALADFLFVEWFDVDNKIQELPMDVLMRVNAGDFGITRIDHAGNFSYETDLQGIYERIRLYADNGSDGIYFEGRIKIVPHRSDDGKPCSYYLDFVLHTKEGLVDDSKPVEKQIEQVDELERVRLVKEHERKKQRDKSEKVKEAKKRERPAFKKVGEEEEKIVAPKSDIVRALELLKEDYKDGIFTKDEYKIEREKLISKLGEGGEV